MTWKKKGLIGILVVLLLAGLWVKRPRTIEDVTGISVEEIESYRIVNLPWEEDSELREGLVTEPADMEQMAALLRESKIIWKPWFTDGKVLYEGEDKYSVGMMCENGGWFDLVSTGKVYVGDHVYKMKTADAKQAAELLEELLQKYEREK